MNDNKSKKKQLKTRVLNISITSNAKKTFNKELKLPKALCQYYAENAFRKGIHHKFVPKSVKVYLSKLYDTLIKTDNMRVYKNTIYFFHGRKLMNVLNLPVRYKRAFKT